MRYLDGSLVGDGDGVSAKASSSLTIPPVSQLNENTTEYDLLPVIVNKAPTIIVSIVEGSNPTIKPIRLADQSGQHLYSGADGTVRVCIGSSITLKFQAEQPDKFNVENGVPTIIANQQQLTYQWRVNDYDLSNYRSDTLRSSVVVEHGTCTIENIQIQHGGLYQCIVSNDIGSVASEQIILEVYNPDSDPKLLTNLVVNPYGEEGLDGWNPNCSELVVKEMSSLPARQLKAINTQVFGYTADMMHPRPYQLDPGVLGVDYAEKLTKRGTYFGRSKYKFIAQGGNTYVKAYQDIDLTELTDLIRGGVYGIAGLRAIFGCYIGSGVSNYKPTTELVPIDNRTNRRQHYFGAPRLSVENLLSAGPPELLDRAYVTIEEFEDETRLPSWIYNPDGAPHLHTNTITLFDPYTREINQAPGSSYYPGSDRFPTDIYGLGLVSNGDSADRILYAADKLIPNYAERFTFGQYVEFNRLILDKLHPRTTKIRVSLNFFCEDYRLIEPGSLSSMGSAEVWDFQAWQKPHHRNTFNDTTGLSDESIFTLLDKPNIPAAEKFLTQPDPRPMITGLTLGLIPILVNRPEITRLYTDQSLTINSRPAAETPTVLNNTPFDPLQRRLHKIHTTFLHNSSFSTSSLDTTAIRFDVESLTSGSSQLPLLANQLLPFVRDYLVDFHIGGSMQDSQQLMEWRVVSSRRGDVISSGNWGSLVPASGGGSNWMLETPWINSTEINSTTRDLAAANLNSNLYAKATGGPHGQLVFDQEGSQSAPNQWEGKIRYILHYVVRDRGVDHSLSNYILQNNLTTNTNPAFVNEITGSNAQLRYNSYLLEIQHPQRMGESSKATLSRTSDMVGSGSMDPVTVEHGINTQGYFYFKLPNEILHRDVSRGGLGIGYVAGSVTDAQVVPRSGGNPITALFASASQWWTTGELYGDQIRRQVVQSIFVGPGDGLVATIDGTDQYTVESVAMSQSRATAQQTMYDGLVATAAGQLNVNQQSQLVDQLIAQYQQLYGPDGNQVSILDKWPFNTRSIIPYHTNPTQGSFDVIHAGRVKINACYDNKKALFDPSSSLGLRGSIVLVPSSSFDIDHTSLVFAKPLATGSQTELQLAEATEVSVYRDYNSAVSLYAVQAVGYGSVDGSRFGGTPMLGYDQAGNYYQVDIVGIHDNIMHDNSPFLTLSA